MEIVELAKEFLRRVNDEVRKMDDAALKLTLRSKKISFPIKKQPGNAEKYFEDYSDKQPRIRSSSSCSILLLLARSLLSAAEIARSSRVAGNYGKRCAKRSE